MTTPRWTVCRHRGNRSSGPSRGSAGTRDRGSVDQRCTASAGALHLEAVGLPYRIRRRRTGNKGAGDAVADAAGPPRAAGRRRESRAHRHRAARRVVLVAARTVDHGFMLVTGVSEPNARGTPWDANSANGLSRMASIGAETLRIHAVTAAPQRVEIGLHAGDHTPRPEPAGLLGGHHLEVLEPMPAAGHRRRAETVDDPRPGRRRPR